MVMQISSFHVIVDHVGNLLKHGHDHRYLLNFLAWGNAVPVFRDAFKQNGEFHSNKFNITCKNVA